MAKRNYDFSVVIEKSEKDGEWYAKAYRGARQVWVTGDGYKRRAGAMKAMEMFSQYRTSVSRVEISKTKTVFYYKY
ncbi:MAG: hypothetical protein ACO1HP_04050 [Bacteroidota bacterium]